VGCNCGKSSTARTTRRVEYVVVDKNGVQHSYRSEMEAKAAVRRFGGGSIQTKTLSPTA
jgi:hypothetical protein